MMNAAATVAIALVTLEAVAIVAVFVVERGFDRPLPSRRAIVAAVERDVDRFLDGPAGIVELDPVLGWRYRAGFAGGGDTLSVQGLRGARVYPPTPPGDTERVVAFGDSFVYCYEVGPHECWTAAIERQWLAEMLNHGVSGYGTDQALLRYLGSPLAQRDSVRVLIGFAPVNMRRNVNRYRHFIYPQERVLFKPRFVLSESGDLVHLPPPVGSARELRAFAGSLPALQRAGEQDHWYPAIIYENAAIDWLASARLAAWLWVDLDRWLLDPDRRALDGTYRPESSHFTLQLALLRHFADSVTARGGQPYFVMFPNRESVARLREGGVTQYQALVDSLAPGTVPVIDLVQALSERSQDVSSLFMPGGHYSVHGNEAAAREIAERLSLPRR